MPAKAVRSEPEKDPVKLRKTLHFWDKQPVMRAWTCPCASKTPVPTSGVQEPRAPTGPLPLVSGVHVGSRTLSH